MANKNLTAAKSAKNDEFYTRLDDIEKECHHYKEHFRDKVIYCNCDDPRESNFFKYFALNFKHFGLKKLITTGYNANGHGVVNIYEGDKNGNHRVDDEEVKVIELKGNGDFRSEECIEFLKEADIVVTNPPFSLFREYMAQLMEYGKKFLIIGNMNAITYKEIFPLIKNGQLWLGYNVNKTMEFVLDDSYQKWDRIENGKKIGKVPAISWFTNLPHEKRNQPLTLCRWYEKEPQNCPKYDNYDAIEVSKVCNIPADYQGVMGVPITFLDKYCPDQFEIVGLVNSSCGYEAGFTKDYSDWKEMKDGIPTGCSGKKTIGNPMLLGMPKKGCYYMNDKGETIYSAYARILIRNLHPISYSDYFKGML